MKKLLFFFFVTLCVQGKSQVFLEQEPDSDSLKTSYEINDGIANRILIIREKFITYDGNEYLEKKRWYKPIFNIGDVKSLSIGDLKNLDEIGLITRNFGDSIARHGWWPLLLKRNIFSRQEIITKHDSMLKSEQKMYGPKIESGLFQSLESLGASLLILVAILLGWFLGWCFNPIGKLTPAVKFLWQLGTILSITILIIWGIESTVLFKQVWIEFVIFSIFLIGGNLILIRKLRKTKTA